MPPFIHLLIYFEGLGTARMLRDDDLGTAFVEGCDDRVAVERLVPEQRTEIYSLDQRLNANGFEALTWQQDKADQIAECIGQSEDCLLYTSPSPRDRTRSR